MSPSPKPHDVIYFESPDALRDWFDANHETIRTSRGGNNVLLLAREVDSCVFTLETIE